MKSAASRSSYEKVPPVGALMKKCRPVGAPTGVHKISESEHLFKRAPSRSSIDKCRQSELL